MGNFLDQNQENWEQCGTQNPALQDCCVTHLLDKALCLQEKLWSRQVQDRNEKVKNWNVGGRLIPFVFLPGNQEGDILWPLQRSKQSPKCGEFARHRQLQRRLSPWCHKEAEAAGNCDRGEAKVSWKFSRCSALNVTRQKCYHSSGEKLQN